jgi:hypothetical protein
LTLVKDTLNEKKNRYEALIAEYNHDRYPQKEVVIQARDLMIDILSQKNNNVALLKRLLTKQDDLINVSEDMEEIEIFFKSQREIFDSARKLQDALQNEIDYFAADTETSRKIKEIGDILAMQKPYGRIKDLPVLMQEIKRANGALVEKKIEQVHEIIDQFINDIHSLAGSNSKTSDEVNKSDSHFASYKQKASAATSLTVLDAMITQLQNYKDQIFRQIESKIHEDNIPDDDSGTKNYKIVYMKRNEVFPVKRLSSCDEVDSYINTVRDKLYKALEENDGIQIN